MAEASHGYLFERLSDDLVTNILDRRLWRPFEWGANKAKERVGLELVCKRFQNLVRTSKSFEWDFTAVPESQAVFLRYIVPRAESVRHIERIALHVESYDCLMTLLLLLVPHSLGTVEVVRLFLEDGEEICIDWETVFRLLHSCNKLLILDINLWDTSPRIPSTRVLTFGTPLNPFPSLQVLSLYGFTVPSSQVGAFIQSFPALEVLELHGIQVLSLQSLSRKRSGGALASHLPVGGLLEELRCLKVCRCCSAS